MDAAALLSGHERMRAAIDKLPTLSEDELPLDDACPICLLPFKLILHPDAASHHPTPEPDLGIDPGVVVIGSSSVSEPGVTRVDGCSHLFCRREYVPSPALRQHGF